MRGAMSLIVQDEEDVWVGCLDRIWLDRMNTQKWVLGSATPYTGPKRLLPKKLSFVCHFPKSGGNVGKNTNSYSYQIMISLKFLSHTMALLKGDGPSCYEFNNKTQLLLRIL